MPTLAIVTPTPALFDPSCKPKRTFSIAHDDFLSERIMIFDIDLERSSKEARIVQLFVMAYDPSKWEYCGKFNEYIKPPKSDKLEERAMEVHGIQPNQESYLDLFFWHNVVNENDTSWGHM